MARPSSRAEHEPLLPASLPAAPCQDAFCLAAVGMSLISLQGRYTRVNPALVLLLGYEAGEWERWPLDWHCHPEEPFTMATLADLVEAAAPPARRFRHTRGHWLWVVPRVSLVRDEQGLPSHYLMQWLDVSVQHHLEEALRASEARFRALTEIAPLGILSVDAGGVIETANDTAQRLLALPLGTGGSYSDHLATLAPRNGETGEPITSAGTAVGRALAGEILSERAIHFPHPDDGADRWVLARATPLWSADGQVAGALAVLTDATRERQLGAELHRLTYHDVLTGLPNRHLLHATLAEAMRARSAHPFALLILELGGFKEVNDTLGHEAGDAVLREVGRRLRAVPEERDLVARLGGDGFAFLLHATDRSGAEEVGHALLQALQAPIVHEGRSVEVRGSIGIALFPEHGTDAATLFRHADGAMTTAHRRGGGIDVYAASDDAQALSRLSLGLELRQAIAQNQLRLYYQPLISLVDGNPVGVECLVRWQHPERGLLGPHDFVPKAERIGLIGPLTAWVLEEGLRQQRAWREEGIECDIAVNLSARSFHDETLPAMVLQLLERYGARPSSLTLEVTESVAMEDPEQAVSMLQRLGQQGVRLAIDDFGTGHSSLGYLRRLPVHQLKIDRSFLANIIADEGSASIVSFIMGLGQLLNLEIVVEGVETEQVTDMVTSLGFDLGQGYYFGRPMPADALAAWWREHVAQRTGSLLGNLHEPLPAG